MKNRCLALLIAAILLVSAGQTSAIPTLMINGVTQTTLVGETEDLIMTFEGSQQEWTLLAEVAGWRDINSFGYFTDMTTPTPTTVFSGTDGQGTMMTTEIAEGTEFGLWMLSDHDGDMDPTLYSVRNQTMNTPNNEYQYFWVFDVSEYQGMGTEYVFSDDGGDMTFTGDYDYLIFVDDSGSGPDYDHNDMIIGVRSFGSTTPIPEPTTLALFGLGLLGARLFRRK